jgi:uncharacterized protein (DUF2345 family)
MKKGIIFIVLVVVFFLVGYTQKIINREKKVTIEASDEIVLKTGGASITMKKDGTIMISGKDITISGAGKVDFKGSGDVIMKGKKIMEN